MAQEDGEDPVRTRRERVPRQDAAFHFRADATLVEAVDLVARKHQITRSAAARLLLGAAVRDDAQTMLVREVAALYRTLEHRLAGLIGADLRERVPVLLEQALRDE